MVPYNIVVVGVVLLFALTVFGLLGALYFLLGALFRRTDRWLSSRTRES